MNKETCKNYFKLIAQSSSSPKKLELTLTDLEYVINNLEEFLSSHSDGHTTRSHFVSRLAELIISYGLVPESSCDYDRDFDHTDFTEVPPNAERGFQCLKLLLKELPHLESSDKLTFFTQSIILCATHSQNYAWSSEESTALSKEFLTELLKCAEHPNLGNLLCGDSFHPTIFKSILKFMRPTLLKDTWMKTASACHVFYWILRHVKHPHLEKYLQDVFPPPFMFTNYHNVHQQVIGLRCFDHILDNVPSTLIRMYGREDAIYHAVSPLIYSKELPIVLVLYPCLLKLPMMQQKKKRSLWNQYDHVLHNILLNLEMETDMKVRTAFLSHVYSFIEIAPPFKHLKRIINVLDRNIFIPDGPDETCRILSLKVLKLVIKSCWPRMEYYCVEILQILLKLTFDIREREFNPNDYVVEELLKACKECGILLRNAYLEMFEAITKSYVDEDTMPGAELLRSILLNED